MRYLLFVLLCISLKGHADEIRLELGEHHPLKQKFSRLWIEDRKIIDVASPDKRNYFIKTLSAGLTHLRLDNRLYSVTVMPPGARQTLADWSLLQKQFVNIQAELCGYRPCLTGRLYRPRDYERILELLARQPLLLAAEPEASIRDELQRLIADRLRAAGQLPLQIIFGKPWHVLSAGKSRAPEAEFAKLGLLLQNSELATELADNVKVAVRVAEVSKNYERKLGVRWPDRIEASLISDLKLSGPESLELALNAAENSGNARILASPTLICRSGKEANFFAGGEFPVKVVTLHSREVQWKKYGIALKLKPVIDSVGQMSLEIETEVSTLDRSISIDDLPALHTNRVSSHFDLIRSRTIAISGLVKNESSQNSEGVPFLKDIPVLGALFESKNFQENKSDLIIFVTPELFVN